MGKIITKLYLYDSTQETNNYRGTDYSRYILLGDSDVDNLDDTLDTVELTLAGLPFREEFAPSTKFIYEKWYPQIDENEQVSYAMWKDWHLCVSNDTVEQPIMSDNDYFNHRLSLTEASVEAQQRLVDNIAITYRLQDVSLESAPTYDVNAIAIKNKINVENYPSENFGDNSGLLDWRNRRIGHQFKWVMPDWYQVQIDGVTKTPSWEDWDTFKLNQEIPSGDTTKQITLPTPMLECLSSVANTKTFRHNGYCSIEVIVQETLLSTNQQSTILTMQVNPNQNDPNESWTPDAMFPDISGYGWIESRPYATTIATSGSSTTNIRTILHRRTQVAVPSNTTTNRTITFTANSGCSYQIIIKRKELNPSDLSSSGYSPTSDFLYDSDKYDLQPAYEAYSSYTWYVITTSTDNTDQKINANYPLLTLKFNSVLAGTNQSLFLRNAPEENAYNLYNKAQLCTQNVKKQEGIPVDETITSFYLEEQDKQELQNTRIVENFYNQKNLWEVQMDIGKYIHARPLIRFGSDNRFVTTWKKYGRTDQKEDTANKISIYNSRFIEEYISAISSYVTNIVQLGGIITETIAPKSSNDDYLVYNDVAEIIVEKPIIEIVDLDVIRKSDNETRNLVGKGTHGESPNGYIFEESVYNILSINANDGVNKGLAIYYKLGTNKIVGLNYQLPSINTGSGDTDYAIKRIIGTLYNSSQDNSSHPENWKDIKINDYLFRISYRTKDTLRSNQSRPDLRKYLLSTKYDRVPQHNQFNNQTDVVVDSVKFGNNIYGKLIRTGNKIYTMLEWVDNLNSLKQSGELYNIDDNLYYVSRVKNIYYADHIESEVEFSKDFNRLSQIIGIPSEPRFYEISERSSIDREISFDDYLVLETYDRFFPQKSREDSYINYNGLNYIKNLLLGEETQYPKYAVTILKNDIDKSTVFGNETFKVETMHPVCCYSIENTLSIEWDMHDNFSAGDQVGETNQSINSSIDTAYYTLKPYRYTDVYGRADMVDFAILQSANLTNAQVMNLPANPIDLTTNQNILFTSATNVSDYDSHEKGIVVLKDNREVLKFNYNLQLLTDSDRFVLSAYMWQSGKKNLRIGLLNKEINKISNSTITNADFEITDIPFTTTLQINSTDNTKQRITINIYNDLASYATSKGLTLEQLLNGIKAIVIYSTNEVNDYVNSGAKYFVFGRNISGLNWYNATTEWHLSYKAKSMFPKQ